jgi:hypothetical protein
VASAGIRIAGELLAKNVPFLPLNCALPAPSLAISKTITSPVFPAQTHQPP